MNNKEKLIQEAIAKRVAEGEDELDIIQEYVDELNDSYETDNLTEDD